MKTLTQTTISMLAAASLGLTALTASAQSVNTLFPVADTHTQDGVTGTEVVLDVNTSQDPDRIAYIKFDLTGVKTVISAEFGMYKTGASRNDTIVTGRWRNLGLLDLAGNTPQDWPENGLFPVLGAEFTGVQTDVNQVFDLDADSGAAITEAIVNGDTGPSTITGQALADFLTERAQNGGLATIINEMTSGGRGYGFHSKDAGNGLGPYLNITYIPFTGLDEIFWTTGSGAWDLATTASWENESGTSRVYGPEVSGIGNIVNFEDTRSGAGDITVTLDTTVQPENLIADTAKTFTISGFGGINGPGGITKNGAGTLSLETSGGNFFTGPVNINEGTLAFSSQGLAGTGPINFNGGTLRYNTGNGDDITTSGFDVRPVTFSADATIDDGGNFVAYSSGGLGNGGAGGLTKTGTGTLQLAGQNTYTGNTMVSEGTLALPSGATISDSAAIIVESGAILDAAIGMLTLNNQTLSGEGSVDGPVVVPVGSTVSPGASVGNLTILNTFGTGQLTMDGGDLDIEIDSGTPDTITVNGNLALNAGNVNLTITGGPLANGSYTLITYTGAIVSGGGGSLLVNGFSQAGQIAFLSSGGGTVQLIVATQGDSDLTWTGSVNNLWDVDTSANWSGSTFLQGDGVTFDAAGAGQPSVDLQGALFPEYVIVDATSDYTFMTTAGGRISGATGLTKNNSGSLTILTDNNNSGLIDINAGTVTVGDGAANAHIGDGGFANDGTLIFNHATDDNRIVGPISGTGSVTKNGASELAIAGDATYTGATTIGAGAGLSYGNGGAVTTIATPTINNEGTLIYNSSSDHTLGATVSGSGGLTKRGTGNLTVSTLGTGDTVVEAGTLTLGAENILGGALTIDGDDATLDLNGFDQTVTGLIGNGNGLITNTASSGTNVLTIDAAANSTMNVLINEAEGGSNVIMVVKSGAGVLNRNSPAGSSTYSGGTLINGPGGFNIDNDDQLGTGPVIFDGGLITMNDQNDLFNPVIVLSVANYEARGNIQLRGDLSGDSDAVINVSTTGGQVFTWDPGATMDNFFGRVNFVGNNLAQARFRGDINGSNATWDMGTNGTFFHTRDGQIVSIGHLIADSNSSMRGATSSDNPTTYVIGGLGLPIDFPGTITDQWPATGPTLNLNRWVGITKEGTSTLTLSGTNLYSGPTIVNGGTLAVTAVGGLDNSRSIIVNGTGVLDTTGLGGTLNVGTTAEPQTVGGSGTIQGDVVANATGVVTVAPGESAGELTITGSLTLAANSIVEMELDRSATPTSDRITAASITEAGTLNVTNIGPILQQGDFFTLFSEAVSGFTAVNLPAEDTFASYTWIDNLATDGTIEVATVTPKAIGTPTDITFVISGGGTSLDLSWPATHLGQFLETNSVSIADPASWFEVPGSETSNTISIPINPDEPQVYFRLRYP